MDQWIDRYVARQYRDSYLDSATRRRLTASSTQRAHAIWDSLTSAAKPSDRFFNFTTPASYWASLVGEDGILVVRDCVVIEKRDFWVS